MVWDTDFNLVWRPENFKLSNRFDPIREKSSNRRDQ